MLFSSVTKRCDRASAVNCNGDPSSTSAPTTQQPTIKPTTTISTTTTTKPTTTKSTTTTPKPPTTTNPTTAVPTTGRPTSAPGKRFHLKDFIHNNQKFLNFFSKVEKRSK